MRLRVNGLLAASLLLSTLSCTKKDTPAATPTLGTGSYKLDNRKVTCTVRAYVRSYANLPPTGGVVLPYDELDVYLTTTPQPAAGPESLRLYYYRPTATSPYLLNQVWFFAAGQYSLSGEFISTAATAIPTSGGNFSGTFAAKVDDNSGINPRLPYQHITEGVFTEARTN